MTAAPYNDTLEPYHQSNHGYSRFFLPKYVKCVSTKENL